MTRFVQFASSLLLLLAATSALAAPKSEEAKDRVKILLVPPVAVGAVPRLSERRIVKALQDALQTGARFDLVTDRDRAPKAAGPTDKGKAVQAKGSAASRRIDEADVLRQEGTDLAAEGKHAEALAKLHAAIAGYEKSWVELVDFTKLADAYARAGLSAFATGTSHAEVGRLFESGVAIQPTLVIDRRKQPKELLDLFDGAHERLEKGQKGVISVEGTAPGADVYVDGVKAGPLPVKSAELLPGTHYVQLRGENWQPWGQIVKLKGKEMTVVAKPLPAKAAAVEKAEAEVKLDSLAECAQQGAFTTDKCKQPAAHMARQTGADFLVFTAIKADRYSRLSLHPFVMDARAGATVMLQPIEMAQDMSDLALRADAVQQQVDAATHPFAKSRALTKPPAVFKEGGK